MKEEPQDLLTKAKFGTVLPSHHLRWFLSFEELFWVSDGLLEFSGGESQTCKYEMSSLFYSMEIYLFTDFVLK